MDWSDSRSRDASLSFDWSDFETPSAAVVSAVAALSGDAARELEPLFGAIDPDSLDGVLARETGAGGMTRGCVRFEYADHRITLESDGCGRAFAVRDDGAETRPRVESRPRTDTRSLEGEGTNPPSGGDIPEPSRKPVCPRCRTAGKPVTCDADGTGDCRVTFECPNCSQRWDVGP